MIPSRSVLIVDRSEENRTVLRTALERQGVRILEATQADQGLTMARSHLPDLIVVDLELGSIDQPTFTHDLAEANPRHQTPLIVLGSMRRPGGAASSEQHVSKPYHYAPLIRRIESLLGAVGETATP